MREFYKHYVVANAEVFNNLMELGDHVRKAIFIATAYLIPECLACMVSIHQPLLYALLHSSQTLTLTISNRTIVFNSPLHLVLKLRLLIATRPKGNGFPRKRYVRYQVDLPIY
jgi:hypothetical protein